MKRIMADLVIMIMVGCIFLELSLTSSSFQQALANVSVLPMPIYSIPGQQVIVDVNISDVTNLLAYDISIWYQNSFANATAVVRPIGHFLEPDNPANEFVVKWEIKNDYNATHGRIWLSYTLLAPEVGRSGSGILARMTFLIKTGGSSHIVLNDYPGRDGPVKLAGADTFPIPHTATDGVIIVGPSLDVGRVPDSPSYRDYVTVTVFVIGLEEGDIQTVILFHSYSSVNGSGATNNTMVSIGGNTYAANIPQYPYLASVGYKVYLMDNWGHWSISNAYNYVVIDNIPPQISFVTNSSSRILKANITEPANASGVDRAYFSLEVAEGDWWNTTMGFDGNTGLWTVTIPFESSFVNQTLECVITAYDRAGNSASLSSVVQPSAWWAADINSDNCVDIFDIVTVAVAFGSKPGDSNWNVLADINNDNLVDIFDIAVVAINFGETG